MSTNEERKAPMAAANQPFGSLICEPLSAAQLESYSQNGFLILRTRSTVDFEMGVEERLRRLSLLLLRRVGVDTSSLEALDFGQLVRWCHVSERNHEYTRMFYEMYISAVDVVSLIGHPLLVGIARALGIAAPFCVTLPSVRIDRPGVTKYLTNAHQDYWYSLDCENAVVVWLPLVDVAPEMGRLQVVPGSHKHGYRPFAHADDGSTFVLKDDFPAADYVDVPVERGEMLVFNQFLVHRSGRNNGEMPRVTMQIRYSDLETKTAMKPSFVGVTSPFVLERQKELLAQGARDKSQTIGPK